ncbi:DUF72 domain-containing protein [Devosia sp.]|uniref:DUF72 domain-containing protein n=1 Tax=Devosia sp. TaxID=1871048 RepID=UPI003BA9718E
MAGMIRLGTAGWVFEPWRQSFYPKGLPQKQELSYAATRLGNIEINATFYSHQKAASFANWAGQTPENFVFTVKGHQLVTHLKKLKDVEIPLANFFASGVMALGSRLGACCWQLPSNLGYDEARLEAFLSLLPKTPEALVALASKADDRLKETPFLDATGISRVRHAIEVRNTAFATPGFVAQLRRHNVALVVADTADWPYLDQTADFAYLRLQGAPGKESYSAEERDVRAGWLKALADGVAPDGPYLTTPETTPPPRDVHGFFVSTDKEHAPDNARAVMATLRLVGPGES